MLGGNALGSTTWRMEEDAENVSTLFIFTLTLRSLRMQSDRGDVEKKRLRSSDIETRRVR